MPRPKGSKNKKTLAAQASQALTTPIESFDEQIALLNTEINELNASLKAKKADLKKLTAKKLKALKAEAERKLEEEKAAAARQLEQDKEKILAAIKESGKSVEEIIEMLK